MLESLRTTNQLSAEGVKLDWSCAGRHMTDTSRAAYDEEDQVRQYGYCHAQAARVLYYGDSGCTAPVEQNTGTAMPSHLYDPYRMSTDMIMM